MENLSQICEKIIQGPQGSYPKVNVACGSAFLEILAMMNQTEVVTTDVSKAIVESVVKEAEIVVKEAENTEIEEPVIQDEVMNQDEVMSQELIQMLLSQMPVQIELIKETVLVDEPVKQPITTQTNTNYQTMQVETLELSKVIQKEVIPKFAEVVEVEKTIIKNEVITEKVLPEKVIEVVEKINISEIQKHFKVLNQNVRLKEIVKNIESVPVETKYINQNEFVVKKEVKLTDVEVNQFKQSIEEMKMSLENITKKDDETIVFKLKPEGLAEIVIKFEQKLGKVTLDISTSNRMVEQLIQKELPHLRDSLKSYQMEVNLSEMGFKNQSNLPQHSKSHQDKYNYDFEQMDSSEEEWMILPETYGFNTYV